MLRDKYKDEKYFQTLKSRKEKWINRLIELRPKIQDYKLNSYYIDFDVTYTELLKISYSLGDGKDNIFDYFRNGLHYFSLSYGEADGILSIIDYFSLAVLFEDRKDEFIGDIQISFDKYLKLTEEGEAMQDDFIDFLGVYLLQGDVVNFHSHLEYLNLIGDTVDSVIEAQKFWYYAHSEAFWYNSHLRDTESYYGYWSFDTAALCKIRGIYDERFKDMDFFPYDLLVQEE